MASTNENAKGQANPPEDWTDEIIREVQAHYYLDPQVEEGIRAAARRAFDRAQSDGRA